MKLEISIDDGHILDMKVAGLCKKFNLPCTFYVPSKNLYDSQSMSWIECKSLAEQGFEFGGHTVSHPMDLKLLDEKELRFEIGNNKRMVEMLIMKKEITKFCYPRGRHNELVRKVVKNVGYKEARTTVVLKTDEGEDTFQKPTTIHVFQRSEYKDKDWYDLSIEMLQKAKIENGMFSLWGHSLEIQKFNLWDKFESLLGVIAKTI